jgi:phenylacetic acid degradation protein paaN
VNLFQKHFELLDQGLNALITREYWKPFQESPSAKFHPAGIKEKAATDFQGLLGKPFEMKLPDIESYIGKEISPFTSEPLGISYPKASLDSLFSHAKSAMPKWRDAGVDTRIGVCLEMVRRLETHFFENAYATMHTTGQGFIMAFAGNGASALERGLEAIIYAYKALKDTPSETNVTGHFGKNLVDIKKSYRIHPVGTAIVMACGSYPAWNALPAIFANLASGNPVIIKPHPQTILPVALQVNHCRKVLEENGFDPNLLGFVPEESDNPVAIDLLNHPDTRIVDFTGSQNFGRHIEQNYRHLQVYTETSGCNSVVIESCNNINGMIGAIAHGLCLFSSQMCTAPQNIFVPETGIETENGHLSFEDFANMLKAAIDKISDNNQMAAGLCGAINTPAIAADIEKLTKTAEESASILRASTQFQHPEYPNARTATPLIVQCESKHRELFSKEWFGPMAFLIKTKDRDEALRIATEDAQNHGAISSYVYSQDQDYLELAIDAYGLAGASVGCNLINHAPLNVSAAFTDFHVTGLNPAGNASLTDLAFVSRRFRITQSKIEV